MAYRPKKKKKAGFVHSVIKALSISKKDNRTFPSMQPMKNIRRSK